MKFYKMQGPVRSPICPNHSVCLIPIPGEDEQLQVHPPIWHPLVWWPSSRIDKEDVSAFLNDTRFPSPVNLDAAIQWHQKDARFKAKNERILSTMQQGGECCVCLEECTVIQFTCYDNHWCCFTCANEQMSCPTCRFIPMKYRENPLVAYK